MKVIIQCGCPDKLIWSSPTTFFFPERYILHPKLQILFVENLLRDINVNNTYHKDIYQDDTIYIITNSDHIMNRLKVAKKEKDITVLEFQFHPFENKPMVKILTDSNGTCSTYPVDFMDEFSNQLLKLI